MTRNISKTFMLHMLLNCPSSWATTQRIIGFVCFFINLSFVRMR